MQSAATETSPVVAAAIELQSRHRVIGRAPEAIVLWKNIALLPDWFDHVREACHGAPPEASKASEWILDNFFLTTRATRQVRKDMPPSYYKRLPALADQVHEGMPRIYVVAKELLNATHLQLSLHSVIDFVKAYQSHSPLSIAELWALPTMLRLATLETLISATISIFPDLKSPVDPETYSTRLEEIEPTEKIARSFMGLRVISSLPWKDYFDEVSIVEMTLSGDPAKIYSAMDFETRDRYRKAVEEIAFRGSFSEIDVANSAVSSAQKEQSSKRRRHVGYWLIDDGRKTIEIQAQYRPSRLEKLNRLLHKNIAFLYFAAFLLGWAFTLTPVYLLLAGHGVGATTIFFGICTAAIPASIVSSTVVNWAFTQIISPKLLPKIEFRDGVSPDCNTAIALPVIVGNADEARALVDRLEMHWLTNPEPLLHFVLLTDHTDSAVRSAPTDEAVENALIDGIHRLNEKHGDRFILLHRPRQYNQREQCWMAWERKRGKLEQFNEFILTGDQTAFSKTVGDYQRLRNIRYVITLDADTTLPMGAAQKLIGTIAHPLNQPEFDGDTRRLVSGYTIIQPRVEIAPTPGRRSPFLRYFTGDSAIDIYSRAVSDIYQDVFQSAVFVGKGVYDVAAMQRTLRGRVPENALLSHDLFEGAHGRVALASDIMLFDGYPSTYLQYVDRWRRWIRGDWQLLPWLLPTVPSADGSRTANCFSFLDRWKIADNLRRSLIPISLVAFAVIGWIFLPGEEWAWTAFAVFAPAAYLFTDLIAGVARGRRREAVQSTFRQFRNHAGRWALAVTFMLYEAVVAFKAILRTIWRVSVSRRSLLQWTSAAHAVEKQGDRARRSYAWRKMCLAPAFSGAIIALVAAVNSLALPAAAPLLLLWFFSPEFAYRISRAELSPLPPISEADREFLRTIARRTWHYFERFVTPEDHWLPPDNFQEDPKPLVAHRTSPTNIGMLLMSSLTAWDCGYVSSPDLSIRIKNVLESLSKLERYRGHFLNWYDTRSLSPLEPRYVSTVDSGNLAVSLTTIAEGCIEATKSPLLRRQYWSGLRDSFNQLALGMSDTSSKSEVPPALRKHFDELGHVISNAQNRSDNWRISLATIIEERWPNLEQAIADLIASKKNLSLDRLSEINVWIERIHHDLARFQWCFDHFFPWQSLIDAPPANGDVLSNQIALLFPVDAPLNEATQNCEKACDAIREWSHTQKGEIEKTWANALAGSVRVGAKRQEALSEQFEELADRSRTLAQEMDFRLLYDGEQRLFTIGYNVSSDQIDTHHYDLLATEARLASYFAIAKGDVAPEHWRYLGRPVTREDGELSLLSWNGSMFEYLMPSLWMRGSDDTLIRQAERTAVSAQRNHAEKLNIPWGVSESGFAARDASDHYQYQAFGVDSLGLRRGLSRDIVIAPYASALALAAAPAAAVKNMRKLAELGLLKLYGFVEAVDFTAERVGGNEFAIVRSFMAHHQGMALAAIGNALHEDVMVSRFFANRQMKRATLLLEERTPWELPSENLAAEEQPRLQRKSDAPALHAWTPKTDSQSRQYHLLGNGRLGSWVSESGAGALWWRNDALTRWRGDMTSEDDGLWIYVRDPSRDVLWSIGRQPTGGVSQDWSTKFHSHMVEFHRRDHGVAVNMNVAVAVGDDLEMRVITLTNETDEERILEITSFGEVALAPPLDDERHPAFSKLFVESTHHESMNGLLFTRRPHHPHEQPSVLLHYLILDDAEKPTATHFETDRRAFLGRWGSYKRPQGVIHGLSNTTGSTLDPVMALQAPIRLAPRARRQFAFVTVAAGSPESALEVAERYATLSALEWAINDASREASLEAHRSGITPEELPQIQRLNSMLLDPQPSARADWKKRKANMNGQSRLWSMGISGDYPILLLRVHGADNAGIMRLLIRAHGYWRRRLHRIDLVILRTGLSGYVEPAREQMLANFRDIGAADMLGRNAGIHLLFADHLSEEDRLVVETTAQVVLDGSAGLLHEQIAQFDRAPAPRSPLFTPTASRAPSPHDAQSSPSSLDFDNEIGGFSEGGHEYVIRINDSDKTPAPWANVIANENFGCLATEGGLGFTWAINSGENRLTPWKNDPVCDPPSEALYLRDEETGDVWTTTPQPAGASAPCEIRHGAGYTHWTTNHHGLKQKTTVFVAPDDPVKIVRLRLSNLENRARRITATYYAEWLLGALSSIHRAHVVCEYDAKDHAILARNSWNPEFGERVSFLTSNIAPHSLTTDRRVFIGVERDLSRPEGLQRWDLGGKTENPIDPCAVYQTHLDIPAGESKEVFFVLGQGRDEGDAIRLLKSWRSAQKAGTALNAAKSIWNEKLSAISVKTPDRAFDLMMNRWLIYQADASRIMARAGFYQAGGAIGFRDQLQDMLALLHSNPLRVRMHILDCASRQFEEGDVLHWWHPPLGRGVRTRCSDDLLWLPFVVSEYVKATGDTSILSESAPFLTAPPLSKTEDDRYALFESGNDQGTLFEHCQRALERGVTKGPHGLPLIGAGDWNDGMNRVGEKGRGESVWLAWFAAATMSGFADLADRIGQRDIAERWRNQASSLRTLIDEVGWDGEWYIRAFDDDGQPWGSKQCDECRIDSIAQSWAVLSADKETTRARKAVHSAVRELVNDEERLVRLFWPPIHDTPRDPGYIKAYPPGIRENGGQYTHAAAWLGLALARMGDGDGAWRVFDLINPVGRTLTRDDAERYLTEPYVLAADVAGASPHTGRGGWSWYTGAAAWTWRLGLEGILGVTREDGRISINPCLPKKWGTAEITINDAGGSLSIRIDDPDHVGRGAVQVTIDGEAHEGNLISFPDDGSTRNVRVLVTSAALKNRKFENVSAGTE